MHRTALDTMQTITKALSQVLNLLGKEDPSTHKRQTMIGLYKEATSNWRARSVKADRMVCSSKDQEGLYGEGGFWNGP